LPYGVASSAIVGKIFGRIEPVLKYHTHKFVAHPDESCPPSLQGSAERRQIGGMSLASLLIPKWYLPENHGM